MIDHLCFFFQIRRLVEDGAEENAELIEIITKFRNEEQVKVEIYMYLTVIILGDLLFFCAQEHHDIGLEEDAELAPGYEALSAAIKVGCKAAIWVSERV